MRRENIQSKLLFGLCLLVCLCGCNSFLNVQPKGTVEQGKQFKDVQGYRDAMYGIYASMAQTSLYGKAMSYGFIDQVGQLFYDYMKQYLLASLYNAPTTMQLSYQNQTNHDLAMRR